MRFLTIALLFSIISCNTSKVQMNKDFKVLKATHQTWQGKGNVHGVYYKITLEQLAKGEVKFDSIYVENAWRRAVAENENPWVVMASITKGGYGYGEQTTASDEHTDMMVNQPDAETKSNITIIRPSDDKKEVKKNTNRLLYRLDGKKKYLEIGEFKTLKP